MEKLRALGQYDDNTDAILLVGRKKEIPQEVDPNKLILIGDCLKTHRKRGIFVEGCPPGEPAPHWAIVDRFTPEGIDLEDPNIGKLVRERMKNETPQFIEHMYKLKAEWDLKRKRRDPS
jgi:hypothetical protein